MKDNPLLIQSVAPFGAPMFDEIRPEHYLPTFKEAIDQGKKEIEKIWSELQRTNPQKFLHEPNIVIDIYKNRRGELNCIKVFRYFDYATCHCEDLFITDANYRTVQDIGMLQYGQRPFSYLDLKARGAL